MFGHFHFLEMRAHAIAFAVIVSGCVNTQPTPAAQTVRFTNGREVVKDCTPLGIIDSSVKTGETPTEGDPYRRLRSEAIRLGANMVLTSDIPTGLVNGSRVSGEAYKCERSK
jgi:hypothetical protein